VFFVSYYLFFCVVVEIEKKVWIAHLFFDADGEKRGKVGGGHSPTFFRANIGTKIISTLKRTVLQKLIRSPFWPPRTHTSQAQQPLTIHVTIRRRPMAQKYVCGTKKQNRRIAQQSREYVRHTKNERVHTARKTSLAQREKAIGTENKNALRHRN
jgi:hypothetical protein